MIGIVTKANDAYFVVRFDSRGLSGELVVKQDKINPRKVGDELHLKLERLGKK